MGPGAAARGETPDSFADRRHDRLAQRGGGGGRPRGPRRPPPIHLVPMVRPRRRLSRPFGKDGSPVDFNRDWRDVPAAGDRPALEGGRRRRSRRAPRPAARPARLAPRRHLLLSLRARVGRRGGGGGSAIPYQSWRRKARRWWTSPRAIFARNRRPPARRAPSPRGTARSDSASSWTTTWRRQPCPDRRLRANLRAGPCLALAAEEGGGLGTFPGDEVAYHQAGVPWLSTPATWITESASTATTRRATASSPRRRSASRSTPALPRTRNRHLVPGGVTFEFAPDWLVLEWRIAALLTAVDRVHDVPALVCREVER